MRESSHTFQTMFATTSTARRILDLHSILQVHIYQTVSCDVPLLLLLLSSRRRLHRRHHHRPSIPPQHVLRRTEPSQRCVVITVFDVHIISS